MNCILRLSSELRGEDCLMWRFLNFASHIDGGKMRQSICYGLTISMISVKRMTPYPRGERFPLGFASFETKSAALSWWYPGGGGI
jgi:hypothetical protein